MESVSSWLVENRPLLILGVGALLVLVVLLRFFGFLGWMFRKAKRMGKPAELHPRLQAYSGHTDEEIAQDRAFAAQILATSSTATVAGYEIVRQLEAVFVEGYRTPNEAATALKAASARRGGNAIINLTHQRTAAGKCSAQGDAVVIEPLVSRTKSTPS